MEKTSSLDWDSPVWTEETVEEALIVLVGSSGEWPSKANIASVPRLEAAIKCRGGIKHWKQRLGVEWNKERVEAELCKLAGNPPVWPTKEQFDRVPKLFYAIQKTGGKKHWQRVLGVSDRNSNQKWNDQEIEKAIWKIVGTGRYWPKVEDFVKANQFQLYTNVIRRSGGAEHWRKKLGLELSPRGERKGRTMWTEGKILAQLKSFVADFAEWPTHQCFIKHDKDYLYQAVTNHGGIEYWTAKVGFENPVGRGGRPKISEQEYIERFQNLVLKYNGQGDVPSLEWICKQDSGLGARIQKTGGIRQWRSVLGYTFVARKWTSERLRQDIKKVLEEVDTEVVGEWFPTGGYFKTQGQQKLHAALSKYGGIRFWAEQFGFDLHPRSKRARVQENCRMAI